ncbi:MAG: ABC transporter permease [Parachlamydia sp.]|nr:ABC transporter permease [Parachlamydia sp.]
MQGFWYTIWKRFRQHRLGYAAFYVIVAFGLVGIYAPFLASSKPFCVFYDGQWYFPFFRYLFYTGFYTKRLDIFFNLLMFTLPLGCLIFLLVQQRWLRIFLEGLLIVAQVALFLTIVLSTPKDPEASPELAKERQVTLAKHPLPSWSFDLSTMTPYAKLNLLLREKESAAQDRCLQRYKAETGGSIPTLWQNEQDLEKEAIARENERMAQASPGSEDYLASQARLNYMQDRRHWIDEEVPKLQFTLMPLRPYHWQDDAGGSQNLNEVASWWDLTRINRKDLVAGLLFGIRISLVVGLVSVAIALAIAVPVGCLAGYYGGTFDIIVCRLLEIWESMPTFFMLLLVVAVTQSKSIFLVIAVIGLFGWTSFSRFLRGEFFKQRNLTYVEACHALGYKDGRIIYSHILPNAVPPLLTLLPFAIMGAIASEAGLSFLGLGEEGSCSWGVLMDEGRQAFPGESYLLWPPAILLTVLLVAIALVGDAFRDALDPKT